MEPTPSEATPELVRRMAEYAALPLAPGREVTVASILSAWLPDANALSAKMSAAAYQAVVPATVFTHPDAQDPEA